MFTVITTKDQSGAISNPSLTLQCIVDTQLEQYTCSFICLQVLNLKVNSQFLRGSEFSAGSESTMNFDDSPEAPSLVSALVAAATIPYIHLRMKIRAM